MRRNGMNFTWKWAVAVCVCAAAWNLTSTNVYGAYPDTPPAAGETCEQYVLRGGFEDWPMGERDLLAQDPTVLAQLVDFYRASEGQPYWMLIAENWMACGLYNLSDGRNYTGWQIGDLNLDGIVNFEDLAAYVEADLGL